MNSSRIWLVLTSNTIMYRICHRRFFAVVRCSLFMLVISLGTYSWVTKFCCYVHALSRLQNFIIVATLYNLVIGLNKQVDITEEWIMNVPASFAMGRCYSLFSILLRIVMLTNLLTALDEVTACCEHENWHIKLRLSLSHGYPFTKHYVLSNRPTGLKPDEKSYQVYREIIVNSHTFSIHLKPSSPPPKTKKV